MQKRLLVLFYVFGEFISKFILARLISLFELLVIDLTAGCSFCLYLAYKRNSLMYEIGFLYRYL